MVYSPPQERPSRPNEKFTLGNFASSLNFTFPDHLVLRIEGGLGHSCLDEVCAWCVPGARLQATLRTHRVPAALYRWDVNQQRMPHEPTDILLLTSFFTFQFPPSLCVHPASSLIQRRWVFSGVDSRANPRPIDFRESQHCYSRQIT